MNAGKLDHRCTLQVKSSAVDSIGQPVPDTWINVGTLWCSIEYQSGYEAIKNDIQSSVNKCLVRVRKNTNITPAMRLVSLVDGKNFRIHNVMDDRRDSAVTLLLCEVFYGI